MDAPLVCRHRVARFHDLERAPGGAEHGDRFVGVAALAIVRRGDQRGKLRSLQDHAQFVPGEPRVDGYRNRSHLIERKKTRHPREAVVKPEADAIPGLNQAAQTRARAIDIGRELEEGSGLAVDPQRHPVRRLLRMVSQQVDDPEAIVHLRRPAEIRCAPRRDRVGRGRARQRRLPAAARRWHGRRWTRDPAGRAERSSR